MSDPELDLQLAERFGLQPESAQFEQALTHPSFANERRDGDDYQRLEFLGDAVLEMCVSELLWRRFPNADEGELTRRRAQIVNARALADIAKDWGVAPVLRLGKGAESTGLRASTNVLADAFEALIAATYLDHGLSAALRVCTSVVDRMLEWQQATPAVDPKSVLQESVQAAGDPAPVYDVLESWGPAHERSFRVTVRVGDRVLAEGQGRSKRDAERAAAERALQCLALPLGEGE